MRILATAIFVAVFVAMAVVELLARFTSLRVPRLAVLLRWAMRRRSTQIGFAMAWWWIGWHFLGSW